MHENQALLNRIKVETPEPRGLLVGGVNHCHLHCRLAKSRGLMRRVKYGAVIGWKGTHSLVIYTRHIQRNAISDQSQRRISPSSSNHGISQNDSVNDSG